MIKVISLIILFYLTAFSQDIREKTESAIRDHFDHEITFELVKYHLPADIKKKVESAARQKFFADDVYIYKIFKGKDLSAAAILDNVYGKSMPITFLVLFDTSGKITSAEIIKYREQYGGAVQNKNWTGQFKGKDSGSEYNVGDNINSISGATISVNSVTAGIRKAAILYNEIKNKI